MVLPSRRRPKAQQFRLRELRSDVRSLGKADIDRGPQALAARAISEKDRQPNTI